MFIIWQECYKVLHTKFFCVCLQGIIRKRRNPWCRNGSRWSTRRMLWSADRTSSLCCELMFTLSLSLSHRYQWKLRSLSTHTYNMLRPTLEMIFPRDLSPVRRSGPSFTFTPPPAALHRKEDKTAYQYGRVCNNVISKTVLFHPLWELDRPKKELKKWLHSPKRGSHNNNLHIYPLFWTAFAVIIIFLAQKIIMFIF